MNQNPPPSSPPPENADTATTFDASTDISTQLTHRYAASTAAQHRHLIATAAALKSLFLDDSLPLTPLSYFAAAMSSLSQPQSDAASSAALATLLSITLPLVPEGSVSPPTAEEAIVVLVRVLDEECLESASSVRCVVKCLGVLLGFCDLGDWGSVSFGFETLIKWSLDRRPKVRKCALLYLENAIKAFQSSTVKKKASTLILSSLESYGSLVVKVGTIRGVNGSERKGGSETEHFDLAHALNIVKVALPHLSVKITVKVVLKLVELLEVHSSSLSRIILNALEQFLDIGEVEVITQVAGDIIPALTVYVSSKNNSKDEIISALSLLKSLLDKIHARHADKWNVSLHAIAGLLTQEDDVASQASNILKNLIHYILFDIKSDLATDVITNTMESKPIRSICSIFLNLLGAGVGIPNEHTLAVISVLFLELGETSLTYMRNIVLKLAEIFTLADGEISNTYHLKKCFGCAVVAMGAENFLSLIPISFSIESLTCSNKWLLPVLNQYIVGASIGYFMEHMVPVAKSMQKASRKVKKSVIGQDLQAFAQGIWGLLPAFCRHPTDLCHSLQSFTKLVLMRLEKDFSTHDDIALALQELVNQNKCLPTYDKTSVGATKPSPDLLEDYLLEKKRLCCFSKKQAIRNLKALSVFSNELLQGLMNAFFVSPPEKRASLKKAINCLASISDISVTKKIFLSSVERFPSVKAIIDSGVGDLSNASVHHTLCHPSTITDHSQWCLVLDLASSIVEGADEELLGLTFQFVKHSLQAGDEVVVSVAYSTLSCVLENHPQFCSSKLDNLVDLIMGLKSPSNVASLSNRLNTLHTLLVHALQGNFDADDKKPFLILNEIILKVKDSKEEVRKAAYDILLRISSSLGGPNVADPNGPFFRLISMILGYLSGPSPHITSAAISALSVLVFKEPEICVTVPDVVPSVTSLLQSKAVEVIKAVLGFIKVLVSCLQPNDLQNFISIIVEGAIPWSSVSRHHFKEKVTVILEIMIRKFGLPAVKLVTPERYQKFIKTVSLNRHGKNNSKEVDPAGSKPQFSKAAFNGPKKRIRNMTHDEEMDLASDSKKRRKQNQNDRSPRGAKGGFPGLVKRSNHMRARPRTFGGPGKSAKRAKEGGFGQDFGKPWKRGRASSKHRKNGAN